jgi:hypothetical protein
MATASLLAQTPAGWQRASDARGRFSVLVPGPLSPDKEAKDADGIVTHTLVANQPGRAYIIVWADGSNVEPQKDMDDARNAFITGMSAAMTSEHRFRSLQPVGEIVANEFSCEFAGGDCRVRMFWHAQRLYMIGVVTRGSGSPVDTARFLDSFQVGGSSNKDR